MGERWECSIDSKCNGHIIMLEGTVVSVNGDHSHKPPRMSRRNIESRKVGGHTETQMKEAIALVVGGMSLRQAAKNTQLSYPTLRRYWMKKQEQGDSARLTPNYEINKIFSPEQELALVDYFFGLSIKDCRKVAFEMATFNKISTPESWNRDQLAGAEWLRGLRNRHSRISLRSPEARCLARATSLKKHKVDVFFDNLNDIMKRFDDFDNGIRIFNLDETTLSTVHKPQKVIGQEGERDICKVTRGEKGTLVTTCCIVSASGQALPPAIVFPIENLKTHLLIGAPTATLGLANASGCINKKLFVEVMKHFIKYSSSSIENRSLLIYDSHEAHLSIEVLDLAKSFGVTVLTVPTKATKMLQPLAVGIFKPFKVAYNSAMSSWLLRNPGKAFSIYDISECIGEAHQKELTPTNIINAFKKTGIFPYNRNVSTAFLPNTVTDRPLQNASEEIDGENEKDSSKHRSHPLESVGMQNNILPKEKTPEILAVAGTSRDCLFVSPEEF